MVNSKSDFKGILMKKILYLRNPKGNILLIEEFQGLQL